MTVRRRGATGRVARRAVVSAWDDDLFSESASAAFWQTLSLPPLLLGLFGILGYVGGLFGPDTVAAVQRWIVTLTSGVFSHSAVDQIIEPTVAQILTTSRTEVVSIGFVLSLWSGSSAMSAFVDAITKAFEQYQRRNLVWQRVLAMLLYIVALVSGILLLPVVALGSRLIPLLPDAVQPVATTLYDALYYPAIAIGLILALTTLYKVALPYKAPWWRGLPGASLAAVVFLVGATGLRIYLDWITGTGYTYGALAAPIAFLLATFFIAMAIILGAHLNAAIQIEWPAPLRRRGVVVPDPMAGEPDADPAGEPDADPAGGEPPGVDGGAAAGRDDAAGHAASHGTGPVIPAAREPVDDRRAPAAGTAADPGPPGTGAAAASPDDGVRPGPRRGQ